MEVRVNKPQYIRMVNTLNKLAKSVEDFMPIWDDFEKYYPEEIVKVAFESRGKPFGRRWQKYNEKYLKWKKKHYSGKPMLVLSGALKQAAINPEVKKTRNQMWMTVNNRLAGIHQLGKHAREFFANSDMSIPARAVLWLIERINKEIGKAMNG